MFRLFTNFILFQCCWFASVAGAGRGEPLFGPIAVLLFVVIHFLFFSKEQRKADFVLIGAALLLGIAADGILASTHWLLYAVDVPVDSEYFSYRAILDFFPPLWILSLWVAFALTINHSMSWSKRLWHGDQKWVVILLGAIFGPVAFLGGEAFGAILFREKMNSLVALAFIWGMSFPLLVLLSTKFGKQMRHA